MNGVIVIDKPSDWTSHDVVARMRRIAGTRKIGHLGTLDPMATGVLPLLLNRATRLAQFFGKNDKRYWGVIRFGWSTNTYDAEGEPASPQVERPLSMEEAEVLFDRFRGSFSQIPPPVSAKKVGGRPAYELARKNIAFELNSIAVTVHALNIISISGAEVTVEIHCTAGTYVRSIAHDAGIALGCGAHLAALRRLASGPFSIDQARSLEQLAALSAEGRLSEALVPARDLLPDFPSETVDAATEAQIRNGKDFRTSPFTQRAVSNYVKAISAHGELVAIGELVLPNLYHPVLVL